MEEELRKMAISMYLQGHSPISIYTELKRSKNWFFKWLKRYQSGDPNWFKEKSRAPLRCPTKISDVDKERIISVRKRLESERFAQVGASAIRWELSKSGHRLPSDRTINRVLKREGLIKKNSIHSQRSRVSIFHRATNYQQHSPG